MRRAQGLDADASAVVRFAGQPTLLKTVSTLPVEDQRQIAQGRPVPVLTVTESGDYECLEMPAYALTAQQVKMVFDGQKVRSAAEQRAALEALKLTKAMRVRPGPQSRVRYDPKTDLIRVGRTSATVGEVTRAMSEAAQMLSRQSPTRKAIEATAELNPIVVKLTPEEQAVLRIRVAESGMTQQEYLHQLLKAALLF